MPRRHVEAGGGNASRTRNVRRSWRGGGGVGMVGVKGREALWVGTDSPLGGFRRRRRRRLVAEALMLARLLFYVTLSGGAPDQK
jgi:hypothetical protein